MTYTYISTISSKSFGKHKRHNDHIEDDVYNCYWDCDKFGDFAY